MLFATVPAAPPTRKNQRTTSCPAPISANVPYHRRSRLSLSALEWVSVASSCTGSNRKCTRCAGAAIATYLLNRRGMAEAGTAIAELTSVEEGESAMARARSSTRKTRVLSTKRDLSTALRMTMLLALSLHSVEGFLENFEIAGVANLFARILNPFLLQ